MKYDITTGFRGQIILAEKYPHQPEIPDLRLTETEKAEHDALEGMTAASIGGHGVCTVDEWLESHGWHK